MWFIVHRIYKSYVPWVPVQLVNVWYNTDHRREASCLGVASFPGRFVGGEKRPSIDCLRMLGIAQDILQTADACSKRACA